MEKQFANEGYTTFALTDDRGKIYGLITEEFIYKWPNRRYYWSLVWTDQLGEYQRIAVILKKGKLLVNPTDSELCGYMKQSKINLN